MSINRDAGDVNALDELSMDEAYRAVPVRNRSAGPRKVPGGLLVEVPYKAPRGIWRLFNWFFAMRRTRRLVLDELGTELWGLCDGTRTVMEIIRTFAQRYRLTFMESRVSVMAYLRDLMQRGALVVRVPRTEKTA